MLRIFVLFAKALLKIGSGRGIMNLFNLWNILGKIF